MNQPNIPGTVLGIDLYHQDSVASFHNLYASGVRVAGLKLGEGGALDPKFNEYALRCQEANIIPFAYWFVRPDVHVATQSALISGNLPQGMALALDLEPSLENSKDSNSDRWQNISQLKRQSWLSGLVGSFKVTRSEHPILYVTADFWANVFGAPDGYQTCPWWAPRYNASEPEQAKNLYPWEGWQFTDSGSINGLNGANNADLSLWRRDFWGIK